MTTEVSTREVEVPQKARTSEAVITVERLVKHYKKATTNAVDDISFEVAAGSFSRC